VGATLELIGLLTAATFRSPGTALERDLQSGRLQAALDELARLSGQERRRLPDVPLNELQAVFTNLFVANPGGLPAPPYAGYARDGKLMGAAQRALENFYASHGLTVNDTWSELPDHLAAVGEAVALLSKSNPEGARSLARGYLRPWFERFSRIVVEEDETGFYGTICALIGQVLEAEYEAES